MICAYCGRNVKKVCSNCWRCKDCKLDCQNHFLRTIDGIIKKEKSKV